MKKIILLFSILSLFLLSGCENKKEVNVELKKESEIWHVMDLTDDFDVKTGERKFFQIAKDGKTIVILWQEGKRYYDMYSITLLTDTYIYEDEEFIAKVKIKIDDKEPFEMNAFTLSGKKGVSIFVGNVLEKELKNGKIMKVLMNYEKGEKILVEFNIENIEEQFKKIIRLEKE